MVKILDRGWRGTRILRRKLKRDGEVAGLGG
jgi:hypothetical protein